MQAEAVTLLLATAPSAEIAERIVTTVVDERLAACGNIVQGVTSIYRWEGAVQREAEVLIVFKTASALGAQLMSRVQQLHPYEVPEILEIPIATGLAPYMKWVLANTNG